MKRRFDLVVRLYIVNYSLLVTHEIDSAFWHEWDLFYLPGGIELFLVVNFILFLPLLIGLKQVIAWGKGAKIFSFILAGCGIFAFVVHMSFIAAGHPEFRTAISIAILICTFLVSLAQVIAVLRYQGN